MPTDAAADGGRGVRTVRLAMPARPEYITLGRLALTGISRLRPLSEEVLADLKLALTEAASNSVRHAYGDEGGVVEILYELHPDRLESGAAGGASGVRRAGENAPGPLTG